MNQVQFLQGAIGVSLGVSRTVELHTWRAQIFFSVVLAEFGGFKSMESYQQRINLQSTHGKAKIQV